MTQTVRNQRRIRWLEMITMFDFDIQHIQGPDNILADALSRIYDGVKEEDLTHEDYLKEERKYLNTDVFLPNHTPIESSSTKTPHLVIPTPKQQNATLHRPGTPPMNQQLVKYEPDQTSQSSSANTDLCGLTGLPYRDGCTAVPIFWEDYYATGRCRAHLANHIDSYSHRMDGIPR